MNAEHGLGTGGVSIEQQFEERFERAPDWPTAVSALRDILTHYTEDDERQYGSKEKGLALLKDTARETMLAILSVPAVDVRPTHSRYTGGELKVSAPSFHVFVFAKAFACFRAEMVPPGLLEARDRAKELLDLAHERYHEVLQGLPVEMRGRDL